MGLIKMVYYPYDSKLPTIFEIHSKVPEITSEDELEAPPVHCAEAILAKSNIHANNDITFFIIFRLNQR